MAWRFDRVTNQIRFLFQRITMGVSTASTTIAAETAVQTFATRPFRSRCLTTTSASAWEWCTAVAEWTNASLCREAVVSVTTTSVSMHQIVRLWIGIDIGLVVFWLSNSKLVSKNGCYLYNSMSKLPTIIKKVNVHSYFELYSVRMADQSYIHFILSNTVDSMAIVLQSPEFPIVVDSRIG